MRKFAFGLSDDLVLECQGAMLNRDMEFARLSGHMQQVEEKNLRKRSDRQRETEPRIRTTVSHRVVIGEIDGKRRRIRRDCPSARRNVGGAKSQENSSVPPPPQKGTTSVTGSGHNRLYALSNLQETEALPDVVT
ncbi:uncharacterized protein LOC124890804, partial [Capsicum annuum]|uniref:uncharacterized protein LOC124890804 n=1 Tax=Capsicum annuum TaxID=4072 RepID=UPI001FB0D72D